MQNILAPKINYHHFAWETKQYDIEEGILTILWLVRPVLSPANIFKQYNIEEGILTILWLVRPVLSPANIFNGPNMLLFTNVLL